MWTTRLNVFADLAALGVLLLDVLQESLLRLPRCTQGRVSSSCLQQPCISVWGVEMLHYMAVRG
jgi:hypothetical protein